MNVISGDVIVLSDFIQRYLPLKNPVLILAVLLLIILFSPIVFQRFRIPGIIGLILAGMFVGPNFFHLIESTSSFELLSKTGLLYIMFLAGLEIDMQEFKETRSKSLIFGALTFIIPITIGYIACVYIFHFSFWPALLLASMFSTHTLISYPIVSNMGIVKNRAVQVTFGGTIITDSTVLLLLGIITNVFTGGIDSFFWIRILISLVLLLFSTLYLLPKVSRWFFRNLDAQAGSHFIYVLSVVFISGFLSELAGVEPIIGAFLAGLGLNRVIPHTGILMNRVVFIGNTLFIPFFLISAGMLVDLKVLFKGSNALFFAGILALIGLLTKYLAAWMTALIYRFNTYEKRVIFGLSVSHAAATLAIIKVGYDLGMFDQTVINGTIILILISCLISSFITESAARNIAIQEKEFKKKDQEKIERILIPISNPGNIERLIDLALLIKDQKSHEPLYPLSIVEDNASADEKIALVRKAIDRVVEQISSGDKKVEVLKKVDLSIVGGIIRTARAYNITDILISYKVNNKSQNFVFATISSHLLNKSKQALILSKILQPLHTCNRIIVIMSPNSELESGFVRTCFKINQLIKQIGKEIIIYGSSDCIFAFCDLIGDKKKQFYKYQICDSFENIHEFKHIQNNDLFVFLAARKQTLSYNAIIDEMPKLLNKNQPDTSFIIFYPDITKSIQEIGLLDNTYTSLDAELVRVKKFKDKLREILGNKEEDTTH